ncbi:aldose epimerase family protein [[Clostridium] polysaccharolyticum]|uniref:Aldose 1-epimerase n=1 Tax=[Clostridium] polysaccharolyticum TaxID=29364 RepID=A0A1I0FFB0_9FIRM|nr:aldose epimerase family protein [[Clostridium] polysaccharolyticum]SET56588.1 aldose 1-epimerase [[Clostridium] polysaccharolyticum]
MKVTVKPFGKLETGEQVNVYTLKNKNGMEVSCISYGAIIKNILVPDKNGNVKDVVLGYDKLEGYVKDSSGQGAFIGRHANRIKDARFEINGTAYQIQKNEKENNLHSGTPAYNKVIYEADTFEEEDSVSVEFSRLSKDMEQGFPGNLDITITYTLTEENEFVMEYMAVSDKDTVINFTNHSYFNLAGHNSGSVLDHKVELYADQFTPTDDELIPTGEFCDVEGTPMDFRTMKKIGQDIHADYKPLKQGKGYDHNFVLRPNQGEDAELIAKYWEEESGRLMEVYTDRPGVQIYTANNLEEDNAKDGASYRPYDAICFETQNFPNAVNTPNFPNAILKAEEEFNSVTVYKFLTK